MGNKKILIFAPYGTFGVHHQLDAMVATALKVRGCEPIAILCDGLFEQCPMAGRPFDAAKCAECAGLSKGFFSRFPFESAQLRGFLQEQDYRDSRGWADGLPSLALEEAEFDGMPLGAWTNSTLHQYFVSGGLDLLNPEVVAVYRGFLYSAALIVRGLGRAIETHRPHYLLCYSGINAFYRVAYGVAKRKGVKSLVHERGFIDDSFMLMSSGYPPEDENLAQGWEYWRNIPLTEEEFLRTRRYFEEREAGKNSNWLPFYHYSSESESVRRTLRIPSGAKIVGMFPTSDWEVGMSASVISLTYTSQLEWMRATAKVCSEEGAYLVIRHHPNNVYHSRVAYPFLRELYDLEKEFPQSVRVVMPDEKMTSYALLWSLDLAVTLMTTMGAEAFVRGIPTICLADYLFRHMGLEWIPSKKNYPEGLRAAIHGRESIGVEDFRQAYRFAYLLYFRLSFRFKTFGIKDIHGVDIRITQVDELAPGRDEVLDRVCNHILTGSPIHPLADPARADAVADAEAAYFAKARAEYLEKRRRIRALPDIKNGADDALVSVIRLGLPGNSRNGDLAASLARSRHRRFEMLDLPLPEADSLEEKIGRIADSLARCRGDFVYIGCGSAVINENVFSSSLDLLFGENGKAIGLTSWGTWLADERGVFTGEAFTERSRMLAYDGLSERYPQLAEPFSMLSLAFWRKENLAVFLAELRMEMAASDTPSLQRAATKIHGKINTPAPDLHKYDMPMGVLHPERDSMETPDSDVAWLLELAGRFPEAEMKYRSALTRNPGDRGSLLNFARMLVRQGRNEDARLLVAPYMAENREDGELTAMLNDIRAQGAAAMTLVSQPSATALASVNPNGAQSHKEAPKEPDSWKPGARVIRDYAEVAHRVDLVPGWLLEGQEKYLFDKVRSLPDNAVILEIGCDHGRSTSAMAFACVGTGKRIYSIDTFCGNDGIMTITTDFIEEWRANLAMNGLDGYVTPVKGYSFDVLKDWKGPSQIDFAFIDASHEYVDVLMDFQLVYPLIKTGGWMAFHDVEPGWPGSWRAWVEYGLTLLTNHEIVATLACGRKSEEKLFTHVDARHADFSFADEYRKYLVTTFNGHAAQLTNAMEISLAGRFGSPSEIDAVHGAEILLGGMPEQVPFRTTLRNMIRKDARLDGHLLLWNAMTLMSESKWEEAYHSLLESTKVSRPLPVVRIKAYCEVLREKMGPKGAALPEPGAPSFGIVSADSGSGGTGAGHYDNDYFNWQKHIGAFGGVANLFKFREFIQASDTVVDLGSGGGYLLHNVACARKMGVEINPAARREASLRAGIDAVEAPEDLPDDYADVVISNHALEHMHSPLHALRAIFPKLKVGGKLVLVVPNDPPQQEWDPKDINKHLFTWNPMTLGNLVALAGFKVLKVEAIQHQWPPQFMQVFERLGEEGFHAACREQALSTGNHQIRVVATRERADEGPTHRFSVSRNLHPAAAEIPVALMTYRRPEHTAKVLKALEALGAKNLYIFSDGPKSDADRADVERTRKLCRSQPWANLKYEESGGNRGLARSIMHATDQILDRNEYLVLLEDDCVPQKHFMDFMGRCLDRYRDQPKVFGVSGYSVPLTESLRRTYSHDAYFFPRIGSWGWATWKRAWNRLDRDLGNAYRNVLDKGIDIHQGGNDIQASVEGVLRGQVKDVWTLNWVLSVYALGGVYAYPTESHIDNIGFDGTGVHCGATEKYRTIIAEKPPVNLPDEVLVDPAIARLFRSFYDVN